MESRTPIITLTTDFGYADPFVGIMKGTILRITPNLQIVDLNHGIAPQDVRAAALTLAASVDYFPPGTIHVAVVDPGVGSERRPILIHSAGQYFVGPDNGVFSFALKDKQTVPIVHLSNEAYFLQPNSRTFHGRDIFAPVAAHLARGVPIANFGSPSRDWVCLTWPVVERAGEFIVGEVLYIDRFGNLFTNIHERDLTGVAKEDVRVHLKDVEIQGLAQNYAAGDKKTYLALVNSWGLVEIASYKGSAACHSQARIGDKVRVELLTR